MLAREYKGVCYSDHNAAAVQLAINETGQFMPGSTTGTVCRSNATVSTYSPNDTAPPQLTYTWTRVLGSGSCAGSTIVPQSFPECSQVTPTEAGVLLGLVLAAWAAAFAIKFIRRGL